MMSVPTYIVFSDQARWRIAASDGAPTPEWIDVPVGFASPADEIAEQIAGALARSGYNGGTVMLAARWEWCMAASISTANLLRRDRNAMRFRLEEKLPLPAEEVVADFVAAGDSALGVCVRLDEIKPFVDALESRGVAVQSVVPSALLSAQAICRPGAAHVLLTGDGGSINVITVEHARPTAWSVAHANAADLRLHVEIALHRSGATEVHACELGTALLSSLPNVNVLKDTTAEAAARAGRLILLGHARPWIELRRDALAVRDRLRSLRGGLNAALTAAAILLLALAGVMWLRSARYERCTRDDERQLLDQFRAEFRGWAVPANVRAVIESEHAKLAAQQAGAAQQASAESALRTLVRVLGSLPQGSKAVLERMTFDDRGFALEGRIAAPGELDVMTSAIRSTGLRVSPPQSQRDSEGTWRFTLRGELPAPAPAPARFTEVR